MLEKVLGAMAILGAAFNMVGGFAITDRMVRLFRKREPGPAASEQAEG